MKKLFYVAIFLLITFSGYKIVTNIDFNPKFTVGQVLDNFNDVKVYYNGGVNHVIGRNLTSDNYNLGLKYQCVEFVKRYYYLHYKHKMPDSYGHAKDFFITSLADNQLNSQRGLIQFTNPSKTMPKTGDIVVYKASILNPYGHVAIITQVDIKKSVEIIQQNPGAFSDSRENYQLKKENNQWFIVNDRISGWLGFR